MDIESLQGQVFGQFELRELLGTGGISAVYRAHQQSLGREVAIKILSPSLRNQDDYVARFQREAKTMASLTHSHIVTVYSFNTSEDIFYIAMTLLPGGTLEQQRKKQVLSLRRISQILNEVAKALDYAHQKGIIHRDIKPGNILFDEQGNSFLSDFGIAKLLNPATKLTIDGQMVGTIDYMAPEPWDSGEITPATDIYALGILSYLLLLGKLPFAASNPVQVMYKHVAEAARFPKAFPKALQTCIEKAIAKKPEERYAKATEFAQAFHEAILGLPPATNYSLSANLEESSSSMSKISPTTRPSEFRFETAQATQSNASDSLKLLKRIYSALAVLLAVISLSLASLIFLPSDVRSSASPTQTSSPTATASATRISSPTATASPSRTPSPTSSYTPSASPTASPTITAAASSTALPSALPPDYNITGVLSLEQSIFNQELYFDGRTIISIEVASADFDPNLSLLDSTGEIMETNDDCSGTNACIRLFELKDAGLYQIAVHSFNGESYGAFSMAIHSIDACSETEPIAIVSGNVVNVREAPDSSSALIGVVQEADCLILRGHNPASSWYFVRFERSRRGWVNALSEILIFGEISELPEMP